MQQRNIMNVEEKLNKLEESVTSLERTLYGYKIGIVILGVCISLFAYYNWIEIPKKVEDAIAKKIGEDTQKRIASALKKADELNSAGDYVKLGDEISLVPVNFPKYFIRHQNGIVKITTIQPDSDLDKKDSSFIVSAPNAR